MVPALDKLELNLWILAVELLCSSEYSPLFQPSPSISSLQLRTPVQLSRSFAIYADSSLFNYSVKCFIVFFYYLNPIRWSLDLTPSVP